MAHAKVGVEMGLARLKSLPSLNVPQAKSNSPAPFIAETQVTTAANLVAHYIRAQRAKYLPLSRQMSTVLRRRVEDYFPEEILENTSLCVLAKDRVEDPPFYRYLAGLGLKNLPSFSQMAAITFVDVVVTYEKLTRRLLFHELVHAVQYQHLGVDNFTRLYVQGFLEGGSYELIPLERHARELEQRFMLEPAEIFSVDGEVRHWVKEESC